MKQLHIDYDIAEPSIQCNADKAEAEVYRVRCYGANIRVLAFSRDTATKTAREMPVAELKRLGLIEG